MASTSLTIVQHAPTQLELLEDVDSFDNPTEEDVDSSDSSAEEDDSSAESGTGSARFIGQDLNPSLGLFFLHCCLTQAYGFRCEHPNPDPSMSLCTSYPPNPFDPYGNNIVFTRTVVQAYYNVAPIMLLCCLTSGLTTGAVTLSLPSSMLSSASRILCRFIPLVTGPHFFALPEAAYRHWQSDILEQYFPQDGPSPRTMSEEDDDRPGNSFPMRR